MDAQHYQINQVVAARVEQVFPYGVFVCLADGTQAYIRRRELTQSGNLDPRQVVSTGDELKALVIAPAEPGQNLELSIRRVEPDPWDTFAQSFKVRDTVTATVKNFSPEGVFVQIIPGVDGFVPLVELAPWQVNQPDDLFWIGDQVEAMITRLDRQSKHLRLSIRQHMNYQGLADKWWAFLNEKDNPEEDLPDEVEPESLDAVGNEVGTTIAERLGRILVVDDHDEVREPLVEWLRRLGFAADGAKSPKQALASVRKRTYGMALLDLELSGEDGLSLIKTLDEMTPDIKLAVMSDPKLIAQRSEELASFAITDAFVKPLNLDEIRETLIGLGQGGTLAHLWIPIPGPAERGAPTSFQRLDELIRSGLPVVTRFEAGLRELVRFTQAEQGLVFHLASDSRQVSIVAQVGQLPLNFEAIYALGESPVKDVIYERDEVFETNITYHAGRRFSKLLALLSFESCLGVPISVGSEVQHALFLFHSQPDAFARYRLRDARAMATLFSAILESQALEQRIRSVSPLLLSGQLAAGFGHEVYNKISGLEIQLRNLRGDHERLAQHPGGRPSIMPSELVELGQATSQLLEVALDLKDTVLLFRELIQAEQSHEVNVNEAVQRTVQLLRPTARQHRVHIELELAPDLPLVSTSAVRLQQLFANLMLNAVQHISHKMSEWPEGRGLVQATTAWETDAERPIRVRFTDNGPGIHHRLWETVFSLGYSTRPAGTGLGLFIARSLVESMGGQVVVERSVIPLGTTFRVELPAAGA